MPSEPAQDTQTVDDHDAISNVCKIYMEGSEKGDSNLLKRAFHSDARMFGEVGGQRLDMPIDQFIKMAFDSPAGRGGKYRGRILSINQTGSVAIAVIAEDGCWGSVSFVDYMSLARFGADWKIVGKTFAHTGGAFPH